MRRMNDERGGALMMVLLLVLVFTILGMSLLTMNISAAKQFNKKGEQVQARHLAEMGLLHYKKEINKEVMDYSFTKQKDETDEGALIRSQSELCEKILAISPPFINDKYKTEKNTCESEPSGELIIEISSEGTSKDTSKKITGTATFTPPKVSGGIPEKPVSPPGYEPGTGGGLPDSTEGYVEVNGPVVTKKETHHYRGTLVINKAAGTNGNTFEVGGGNSDKLYVGKDFYIGGNFHVQNHSCMIVGGNLTVLGTTYVGTQTKIIVYGDAYFEKKPSHKPENIYVVGNAWVGNPAKISTDYNNVLNFSSGCPKPAGWPDPSPPIDGSYQWKLEDELNPVYDPELNSSTSV